MHATQSLLLCKSTLSKKKTLEIGSSSPCLHGGMCGNLINRYQCLCLPGYSGSNCENGMFCFLKIYVANK
jgi:hypothetical protein